jgi:hypothetical protein
MKRIHLVVGLLGVVVFVLTGQVMARHVPPVKSMEAELRLMYVSRHIYLLGAALVNLMTGLYLRMADDGWQRRVQVLGSAVLLLSPLALTLAFFREPPLGLAGRSWMSRQGLFTLLGGVLLHAISRLKAESSGPN